MPYSTKAEVKALLRITTTDHDAEIDNAITDVDARIDNLLKQHTTVPVSPTPSSINKASKYLAAALFRRLNPLSDTEAREARVWEEIGRMYLEEYIRETYYEGTLGRE